MGWYGACSTPEGRPPSRHQQPGGVRWGTFKFGPSTSDRNTLAGLAECCVREPPCSLPEIISIPGG